MLQREPATSYLLPVEQAANDPNSHVCLCQVTDLQTKELAAERAEGGRAHALSTCSSELASYTSSPAQLTV